MSFLGELQRRNVLRVAAAYAAVAWLVVQVAETLFPIFGLGDSAVRLVVVLLAVGFVPVVVIAWAFDLTPEGLRPDGEADPDSAASRRYSRRLDRVIIVTLALALTYLAVDKFVLDPARDTARLEQAREAGRTQAMVESYGDKSIAVLPFADMSAQGDQAYFSEGISEELLNLLARSKDLRVISRSSSFALRDEALSITALAEKLNANYVLEGSVRKAGNDIRIAARLVDARSDTQLWSDTYDGSLDDVLATQKEIAAQVVEALKARILGTAPAASPANSAAYELYLQGLSPAANRRNAEDIARAIDLFDRAIAIDPEFAPAYAHLALTLIWSDQDLSVRDARLEAAVKRARALDPGNSNALAALGRLRFEQNLIEEARALLTEAVERNPNNALAYRWLGTSYAEADPVRYYDIVRKAFELNPVDPDIRFHLTLAASMLGRYSDALTAAEGFDSNDRFRMAGNVHHDFGHLEDALKSYYLAYRVDGDFGWAPRVLIEMNELDLAEAWVRAGKNAEPGRVLMPEATLAALRGQPEEAFQIWDDAARRNHRADADYELGWAHIRYSGDFDAAREALGRYLLRPGESEPHFEPDNWQAFMDYALALQRTGSTERAAELIGEIKVILETRLTSGMVRSSHGLNFQFFLSAIDAMAGDPQQAVVALRHAAAQGGLSCTHCVRTWPHWDSLRGNADFEEVIAEAEARKAAQRQRLADADLLLTPSAVRQLKEFSFDPFEQ